MHPHETYMQRCLQLALLGAGSTAPNPMVGAVLVQGGRIIGEGHTQPYGGPHAEVMCLRSVAAADNGLLAQATLYVSLEPCAHHGKTPPCTDLIIRSGIPRVVIGCGDPFEQVNGRGIAQLQAAGVQVTEGVLEAECKALNKSFFTYHQRQRPYIILKWAQSGNGYIAATGQRTAISGPMANRLVHRWRSEAMAIMVGAQTAIIDNPHLTVRLWEGKNPLRIVAAGNTPLSSELHLFNGEASTLVFARQQGQRPENVRYHLIDNDGHEVSSMLTSLYQQRINSVLVEGGAKLLQNFIDSGLWDEARVITNTGLHIPAGTKAPVMQNAKRAAQQQLGPDNIVYYVHSHSLLGMLDSSSTAANT